MNYASQWSFFNPVQLNFGRGCLQELPALVSYSDNGLLVTSPSFTKRGITAEVIDLLQKNEILVIDNIAPNPDLRDVESLWQSLKGHEINYIIAIGGGSVLDTAKALSYLLSLKDRDFTLSSHFRNKIKLPENVPLPLIAAPTTAGTGSEVTPFATIWDMVEQKKYSLARPNLFPAIALLDPELTISLPWDITVITGLDALSHALESVWNRNANPVTLHYAAKAISLVISTLPRLKNAPSDIELRAKMLTASLFGGLCISSTRTALAHSMSYPITAAYDMPHGLACGFTLPALLSFNARADDGRLAAVANEIGLASVEAFTLEIKLLFEQLDIKELLNQYNITFDGLIKMRSAMFTPGRTDNNLRSVEENDLNWILSEALE